MRGLPCLKGRRQASLRRIRRQSSLGMCVEMISLRRSVISSLLSNASILERPLALKNIGVMIFPPPVLILKIHLKCFKELIVQFDFPTLQTMPSTIWGAARYRIIDPIGGILFLVSYSAMASKGDKTCVISKGTDDYEAK